MKPKVAVFDFTGCEGCELNKLNFENELLDIIAHIDFVEWREAMDDKADEYDIAFIEGSISTPECVDRIHDIRNRSKILIALGACAVCGGMNAMKNQKPLEVAREEVYGKDKDLFPTLPALPLSAYVKVDFEIRGCPMTQQEFLRVVTALLMGKNPIIPDYAVCVECKLKENECVYGNGMICMGPITRAGCDAQCPSFGQYCIGCRGLVSHPNKEAMIEILTNHGLSVDEADKKMSLFNTENREGGLK
ncbi:MAG: NADH:ubiquinone oxidoreductase [Candidatus Marinimicrobia bacterium]|nr:NADH:ubiquinone oxidoreductase [Candidatus Neomarinimicrobiota bacterium]MBL7022497.1 NADH:ubiquinone oxidoreductase [Candidatus Neomarinimicrobiota bacterium]MBL7108648.1 NADH:ubiquinone oxidoreductase [Candidatus Neomarinimicrobiota bacterium]